jgi:hypothetical protein
LHMYLWRSVLLVTASSSSSLWGPHTLTFFHKHRNNVRILNQRVDNTLEPAKKNI